MNEDFQVSDELRRGYGERVNLYLEGLRSAMSCFCSPRISDFHVKSATLILDAHFDKELVIGGNVEYATPFGIHSETSLVSHAINKYGPEETKRLLEFIAIYSSGGAVTPCGDCRDFLLATTDPEKLVIVSAGDKDRNVQIYPFKDFLFPEEGFEIIAEESDSIAKLRDEEYFECWNRAVVSRGRGGINLFKPSKTRAVVAARKKPTGSIEYYEATSCDDAAFHYRYPIGGALQAAASDKSYFVDFIAVSSSNNNLPRISYRDRQYAKDADGFNKIAKRPPLKLILARENSIMAATLDKALPHSFSTADFAPEKIEEFLKACGAL